MTIYRGRNIVIVIRPCRVGGAIKYDVDELFRDRIVY